MYEAYLCAVLYGLCNFLGACSQQSHQVVISSSNSIPIISLNSKSFRTTQSRIPFSVSGSAYTVQCGSSGKQSTSSLEYSWRIQRNGLILTELESISVNPKVFQLSPYSLSVGELYVVGTFAVPGLDATGTSLAPETG